MGLLNDKRNIFNEIGALSSIGESIDQEVPTNSFSSINNKREIIPFLLDLLSTLVGVQGIKKTVGQIFTDFARNVDPTLKQELVKQNIEFNSNEVLPPNFVNGYSVPVASIDTFGNLRTDPASDIGQLVYGNNPNNFDRKVYESLQAPATDITYGNLLINYDEFTDELTFKPANPTQTNGEFTTELIDNFQLIDPETFPTNIMNQLFGTVTSNQNKTQQTVIQEEKFSRTVQKIIDEEVNLTIPDTELEEIERISQDRVNGVNKVNVGCTLLDSSLTVEQLQELVNIASTSNDPLAVGNAFQDAVDGSFETTVNTTQNENTVRDGFFKRLINAVVNAITTAMTGTPQARTLLFISSGLKNNDTPTISDPIDDLIRQRPLAQCYADIVKRSINEFIFNIIKTLLITIVAKVLQSIIREKIEAFINIIRSLIS
jgi:hypothetical protein